MKAPGSGLPEAVSQITATYFRLYSEGGGKSLAGFKREKDKTRFPFLRKKNHGVHCDSPNGESEAANQ